MFKLLVRRLVETIPVLLLMSIVVFGLVLLVPGDPVLGMLGPSAQVDKAVVEQLRRDLQLDQPLPVQYLAWLLRALRGDLGRSIATHQPVIQALLQRFPVTFQLAALSTVIAVAIAFPLGIIAAVKRNSIWDVLASGISVIGLAVPNFWLGILLILLFAIRLRWLPASGYVDPLDDPLAGFKHLLMPSIALGLSTAGTLMRQVRSSLLEVLRDDYIRTARAKGLAEKSILFRHALKNSLIPIITVLGILIGRLMGGSLIVESIFLVPGIGSLLINAIFTRDFPVVQGGALVLALVAVLINLVVDMLYGYLDPRISQ